MKKIIQPETYGRLWACLGVYIFLSTGPLLASPVHPPADSCQAPAPPRLKSSVASLCRGEPAQLTATGCSGTVIWSTGETGPQIDVRPLRTVRYTAVCRSQQGCVSCFADPVQLTVATPAAPTVTASSPAVCPGESVTLTATEFAGLVRWPDGSTGARWVVSPSQTGVYQAVCLANGCTSNASAPVQVLVGLPQTPLLVADKPAVCNGQSVQLTATGCIGRVRWSDGDEGVTRSVIIANTTNYRATCVVGTCRSDSSASLRIVMTSPEQAPRVLSAAINTCPFQTADLTRAITESSANRQARYEFRTQPRPDAPPVQTATAVLAGTYFIFERSAGGCYSAPAPVVVTITPCPNAIPACLSSPALATVQLDTVDHRTGVVRLRGQLHGSAASGHWQTTGTGLFTDTTSILARYVASETDLLRGSLTFTLATNDPDGSGPCRAAEASLTVSMTTSTSTVPGENGQPGPGGTSPADTPVQVVPETTLVFIPEGFSPNNDGINDRFVIRQTGQLLPVSLDVFNRWGQLVYQSEPYKNDWDGTANRGIRAGATGAGLPDGTYFYAVRLSDGREFTRFLTLSR